MSRSTDIGLAWPTAKLAALLRAGVWPDLSDNAVAALRSVGRFVDIPEGRQIASRAEPIARLYLVLTGAVRLCMRTSDDREFVAALTQPGNLCFLVACLDGRLSQYDAYAQIPTTALAVGAGELRALMQQNAELQNAVLMLLCRRLRQSFNGLEQFAMWTPRARLAACLLGLARSGGQSQGEDSEITSHLQQASLAAMIGVSRPRTNKMLKALEEAGVLRLGYGRITIRDPGRLRDELGLHHPS